jgi:hypothetical protein
MGRFGGCWALAHACNIIDWSGCATCAVGGSCDVSNECKCAATATGLWRWLTGLSTDYWNCWPTPVTTAIAEA